MTRSTLPPHLGGPAPLLITYAIHGTLLAAWADPAWLARRWRLVELQRKVRDEADEPVRFEIEEPGLLWIDRQDIGDAPELRAAIRHLGISQRWTMVPRHHLPEDLPLRETAARFVIDPSGRYFALEGALPSSQRARFRMPATDTREICFMQLRVVPDAEVPAVMKNLLAESTFDACAVLLRGVPVPGSPKPREILPIAGSETIAGVLEHAPTRVREQLIARLSEVREATRSPRRSVRP